MSATAPPAQSALPAPAAAGMPGTGGMHWPPTFAVAWVTFLEFWRRWFLLGLLVIGLMPGILATFMPLAVQHGAERVELIILWGLGGVAFGGALGASLMASLQTPMEIEDRRIYGLVCRPVGRWRLMIGKMFGCALFLLVYALICYGALVGLTTYSLSGQADAGKYRPTRTAQDAVMLGMDVQAKHVVPYSGQAQIHVPFDFTASGPINDWGRTAKDRYRWVLLTCVRSVSGQPDPTHVWDETRPAFHCGVNGRELLEYVVDQDQLKPLEGWFIEPSGHVVLIIPESLAAAQPSNRVQITLLPTAGYFQPGDVLVFSDLAVYDNPKPAYDDNLQRKIPFVRTIATISPEQSACYLLARSPEQAALPEEALFVGMMLKSAAIFRDIFAVDVSIERFTPDHPAFQVERQAHWVVNERKMHWIPVQSPSTGADSADLSFGPVVQPNLTGWQVLRLHGLPAVQGVRDSGALFQVTCQGDIRFAAVRSTLGMNLLVAIGLLYIQWFCLVVIVVAWSGNLSLGIAVLCSLILAVSCYGSGAARSVLTEEHRTLEYRNRMHELHPEMQAPPVSQWQFALNTVMTDIIWAPPDFMQYSPTERVREQTDISFQAWGPAALYLLLLRAVPISLLGLLVFQRREF
ncbi:MAG TPA: hypothetical protein VL860_01465 [Planctomycetota bacterium]|nr:hypothetical protein [Planctomycetota bacterium]